MRTYQIRKLWHDSSYTTSIEISPEGAAQMRAKGLVETSEKHIWVMPCKSRGKYRKNDTCPYCGSTRIDPVDYDECGDVITGCDRCGSEWDERDSHTIQPTRYEAIANIEHWLENGMPVEELTASERKLLGV